MKKTYGILVAILLVFGLISSAVIAGSDGHSGRKDFVVTTNKVLVIGPVNTNQPDYVFADFQEAVTIDEMVFLYSEPTNASFVVTVYKGTNEYTRFANSFSNQSVVVWNPSTTWLTKRDKIKIEDSIDFPMNVIIDFGTGK